MNRTSLVLFLTLALAPLLRAQSASPQAPPPGNSAHEMHGDPHDHMMANMMEMHHHEMEAMKADVERMKLSLAQMKANVPQIRDSAEKARWESNVDLWEVMLSHMQRMLEQLDSMGHDAQSHGMMHDHGTGPMPPPPAEKKPE